MSYQRYRAHKDYDEQLEREQQKEADRLASEANPPKPAEPIDPKTPPSLTAEAGRRASNERVKAGEQPSHWTGD